MGGRGRVVIGIFSEDESLEKKKYGKRLAEVEKKNRSIFHKGMPNNRHRFQCCFLVVTPTLNYFWLLITSYFRGRVFQVWSDSLCVSFTPATPLYNWFKSGAVYSIRFCDLFIFLETRCSWQNLGLRFSFENFPLLSPWLLRTGKKSFILGSFCQTFSSFIFSLLSGFFESVLSLIINNGNLLSSRLRLNNPS